MLKKIFITLVLCLFSGPSFADDTKLYANIVKGADGKYVITEITTDENKIDLSNLQPVGYDTATWDCSKILFGSTSFDDGNKECMPAGSEFRAANVKWLPTIFTGLTTSGISLLVGLTKVESSFDIDSYNKALKEALESSGLDKKRELYLRKYTRLLVLSEKYNEELKELYNKYTKDYNLSTQRLEKRLIDLSGYYKKDDLLLDVLIKVNRKTLSSLTPPKYKPASFSAPPREFENKLQEIEDYMTVAFKREKALYEDKLKLATAVFDITCGPEYMQPYHIRYECPRTVQNSVSYVPGSQEAKAIILSKDFTSVFPPSYTLEDMNLKMSFTKDSVLFENKTGKDLNLLSITLYYNGKTSNYSPEKESRIKELPPYAKSDKVLSVKKLVNKQIEKEAEFKEVTSEIARRTKVDFRMTIKYRVDGDNGDKVLIDKKEYSLEELI